MLPIFVSVLLINLSLVTVNAGLVIQKCKHDDAQCIKDSAHALLPSLLIGIPEFKIPSMNDLTLASVDASTHNLKLMLKDFKLRGLDKCKAQEVRRDAPNKKIFGKVLCEIEAEGQYEMKGQLLVLPIEGNGNLKVITNKIFFDVELDLGEKTEKDGKVHWTIKNWKYTYELKDKAIVKFENLFPGNKEVAQATEEVISKSGNEIIGEVGGPVLKAAIEKLVTYIGLLFKHVPVEDLVLDE